ncbi:MAG: exosortase/archaeosortase family protein [Verrucomicrobiaceae bacterium]
MQTESTQSSFPASAVPAATRLGWLRHAALWGLPAVLVLLFLVWPYQQWDFGKRQSIMTGWARWVSTKADWQFCLLVPALVGWLVWQRRAELRKLPWNGEWTGLLPLVAGLFFFWLGYKADTGYPGFLAVQLVLAGMILLVAGRAWMRVLFFSWLFLFFAWPMQPLEDSVASPLRPKTAAMAASLLNLTGVPAINEGSALQSAPDTATGLLTGDRFSLDVDAKCSGINSLFALMMISALLGYLTLKRPRTRLVLFACSIPFAVAGNVARLLLLVAGTLLFGSDFAVGRHIGEHQEMSPYHTFAGFAVFGVALAGMFALCWLFEGREMKAMRANMQRHGSRGGNRGKDEPWAIPLPRRTLVQMGAALLLPLAALGICAGTDTSFHVSEPGVVLRLPLSLGDYQGREFDMTAEEKNLLDEGVKLARTVYASSKGRQIMATLILSGHVKRSLHRPEVCLPGQGWTVMDSTHIPIRLADGREITTTLLRIFRDSATSTGTRIRTRALNLYWYIGSDGTTCPDHYGHVFHSYYDSVFRGVQHRWAMASIYVQLEEKPVGEEAPLAEFNALEDAREFISRLAPTFMIERKNDLSGSNPPASTP